MTDRRTLEDALIDRGVDASGQYPCPSCRREFRAFALVDVSDISAIADDVACADCLIDAQRTAQADIDRDQGSSPGWDGDLGAALRAERSRLLDLNAWTIRADSPLTKQCREAWADWYLALHQMTLNSTPESWAFPSAPDLEYMAPDEAADRLRSLIGKDR